MNNDEIKSQDKKSSAKFVFIGKIKGLLTKIGKIWPDKVKRKHVLIAIGVIVLIVVLFKAVVNVRNILFKKKEAKEVFEVIDEGAPVKVYKVRRMDFKDTLPVLGMIKGYKEIMLKFQVSGLLESFNFEEGEKVQEGDIIANLEQRDALLKLKYAELELDSAKKIFELGGIIENALEKAKLEYESAKSDLEKTNIYAVSDGVLGIQDMDVGSYVSPNDRIGIFIDITKVYAEFDVIEKDVPKLKLGQKSEVFVDALPNKDFVGTVDTISPLIEGRTRTQRVRVELKNPDGVLKPGMFIRGLISTYEKKNAIIIPASSLKKKEEGYIVYVVRPEEEPAQAEGDEEKEKAVDAEKEMGTIEIRPIKISYMTQDKVEIEEGLEEGELIVMELAQDFQDKEKVEVVEIQEILY